MRHLFLIFGICFTAYFANAQEYVTVETTAGTLRGEARTTQASTPMYSFQGIPYAETPTGALRFQPPVTKSPWTDVRDALQLGSACTQSSTSTTPGSEDCLFLNVYSPELPPNTDGLKPVMVWIHGGCFTGGQGDATPDYFVDNGIVFVAINYRLGLLGFLSTGDDIVPGNMGLKDQAEALRWVQNNIAIFGGDPEQVTIFGQSAGGASIHYHVLSPSSNGLFSQAIAHSGSALNPWAFSKNATDRSIRFANYLGYSPQSSSDLLNFFMTVDASVLVENITNALSEEDSLSLFSCVWAPSVEPEYDGAFLTEEPDTLVAEGRYTYVPYISGNTDLELLSHTEAGGFLSTQETLNYLSENFNEIVGCDLRLPTREEQLAGAGEVRQFYYGDSDITLQNNYTTALFDSHLFFVEGVDTVMRSMVTYSTEPVYYYQFTYNGVISQYPGGPGAAHSDDVIYLFATSNLEPGSEGAIVRDQMIAMWTNFAKVGNPTPEITTLLTQEWPEYTSDEPAYLEINAPLTVGESPNGVYMDFWHQLLP